MFSQAQLDKFAGKKRISQETFDEAVKENVEEFDMEPEEALQSAVAEFEAQGVDLSGIIKSLAGGDVSGHPAAAATASLTAAVAAGDEPAAAAAMDQLAGLLSADAAAAAAAAAGGGSSSAPATASTGSKEELGAVLLKAQAVQALLACLPPAAPAAPTPSSSSGGGGGVAGSAAACGPLALPALQVLPSVLSLGRDQQRAFLAAGGAAVLGGLLASDTPSAAADDAPTAAAALRTAAAAATRCEDGKAALMDWGACAACIPLLGRHGSDPGVVAAACALLTAATFADDDSLPSSRAFPNARALAKLGSARALVASLRRHTEQPQETTVAVAGALRLAAANDEICQEVAAEGGVALALAALEAGNGEVALARPLCALLRQLASSDACKAEVVGGGGLAAIRALLEAHASSPAVVEQALGLLTNLTLRNPETAEKAVASGCADAVLEAMQGLLGSSGGKEATAAGAGGKENAAGSGAAAAGAQRQGCMALRNIASRSPDLRPLLLERGAEALLRRVRTAHPSTCGDAGTAALRDLGLDNYYQ